MFIYSKDFAAVLISLENGRIQLDGNTDRRRCVTPAQLDVSAGKAGKGCLKNKGTLKIVNSIAEYAQKRALRAH